jgi:hypothetical protein
MDLASEQSTLVVARKGPADHRKITDAIKAAAPGSRILVRPGTYSTTFSQLVIEKPVELLADGPAGAVIIENTAASCILARADYATVRGFTLRIPHMRKPHFAVDIARGALVIEDCDITSASMSCIVVHGPGTVVTIRGCRIHESAQAGILVCDHGKGTIGHLRESDDLTSRKETPDKAAQTCNERLRYTGASAPQRPSVETTLLS